MRSRWATIPEPSRSFSMEVIWYPQVLDPTPHIAWKRPTKSPTNSKQPNAPIYLPTPATTKKNKKTSTPLSQRGQYQKHEQLLLIVSSILYKPLTSVLYLHPSQTTTNSNWYQTPHLSEFQTRNIQALIHRIYKACMNRLRKGDLSWKEGASLLACSLPFTSFSHFKKNSAISRVGEY